MKTNFQIVQEINTLAKKHYGDSNLAFAWGCAQSLLTTQQLDLILGMLKEKESEMLEQ
jgi:hypothetical protein